MAKLESIYLPFPLNLVNIPLGIAERRRDAAAAQQLTEAAAGAQALEMGRIGLNADALGPLSPVERARVFERINQAQPPGYPRVEEMAGPSATDRARLLLSPEMLAHPEFESFAQRIAGSGGADPYTLKPGERRFEGSRAIAENPLAPIPVSDGSMLYDPAAGETLLDNPKDFGNQVVPEGGVLVRPDGSRIFKNPKTAAPGSGGAGSDEWDLRSVDGALLRVHKRTGQVEELWGGGKSAEGLKTLTIGETEVSRTQEANTGDVNAQSRLLVKLQEVDEAEAVLNDLESLVTSHPEIAGSAGAGRRLYSSAVDLAGDVRSAFGGAPPPAAAAQLPQEVQQRVDSILTKALADPDPAVREEASRFYAQPDLRGTVNALVYAAGYAVPKAKRDSGRLAVQETIETRKVVDPAGRASSQEAIETIRAMRNDVRTGRDRAEQLLAFQPGISVRRVPRGTGPPRVTVSQGQLNPGGSPNGPAPAPTIPRFRMDASGNLVPQ